MKKNLLRAIIILGILFSLVGKVKAQDSISIPVSCSIPAVPGLNAPLLLEDSNEKINLTFSEIIQQTKETASLKIITLYSR